MSKEKSQFNTIIDPFSFDFKNLNTNKYNSNYNNSNSKDKNFDLISSNIKPSLSHIVSIPNINLITREIQTDLSNPRMESNTNNNYQYIIVNLRYNRPSNKKLSDSFLFTDKIKNK